MKSKAGNKLKKVRGLVLIVGLALTGCLTEPQPVIHDHEAPAGCLDKVDSVTFSAPGETWHYFCFIGDSTEPQPPSHPQ